MSATVFYIWDLIKPEQTIQMKQDSQEDKQEFMHSGFLLWSFLKNMHYFDPCVSSKDCVYKLLASKPNSLHSKLGACSSKPNYICVVSLLGYLQIHMN